MFLTSTHLGIAMEYASGGELFDRIVKANRFSEDEARYFFQQLISGVSRANCFQHSTAPCHPGGPSTRVLLPRSSSRAASSCLQPLVSPVLPLPHRWRGATRRGCATGT